MKEHDKKIVSLMNNFSEKGIIKEVNMLHFMSGFSISEEAGENILLLDNILKKIKE